MTLSTNEVFVVFESYDDPDGWGQYAFIGVASSEDSARQIITEVLRGQPPRRKITPEIRFGKRALSDDDVRKDSFVCESVRINTLSAWP